MKFDVITMCANFVMITTILLGLFLLILFLAEQDFVKDNFGSENNIFHKINDNFLKILSMFSDLDTPKSGSSIYEFYEKFIVYTRMDVKTLFRIKNGLAAITFVFLLLMQITNMDLGVKEIYSKFDYDNNPMFNKNAYTQEEKDEILIVKNQLFDYMKDEIGIDNIMSYSEETAKAIIKGFVVEMNTTNIDKDIIIDELYAKAKGYMNIKQMKFQILIFGSLAVFFLPEVIIFFINLFNRGSARADMRFMKRLIIMNGSIKPTDFMMVLSELIDKSKYYKKVLKEIEDFNKKNYEENTKIYMRYIQEAKDVETKLFFEKLDEANNYDFDQAIMNIKNEFNLDKRMQTRKCKKLVEQIHVWGLLGFMALICIMIMYLLMPWLTAYSLDSMM